MIGRRGALRALFSAPVAAALGNQAQTATQVMMNQSWDPIPKPGNPYSKYLRAVRNAMEIREDSKSDQVKHMPVDIRTKRSWSEAFKVHAWTHERLARDRHIRDVDWWDDDAFAKYLISQGIKLVRDDE